MNVKKIMSSVTGSVVIASMILATTAFAEDSATSSWSQDHGEKNNQQMYVPARINTHFNMDQANRMAPIISGAVTTISGNTITVSLQKIGEIEKEHENRVSSTTPTVATSTSLITYTIDATHAQVWKNNATTSLSSILVGDMIYVRGKITASRTINATVITDGVKNSTKDQQKPEDKNMQNQNDFLGDGQPVVGGVVSAVASSTLTVATNASTTYTVDVTNAKIFSNNASSTFANIKVGDKVLVQGAVNENSIVATGIVDQTKPVEQPRGVKKVFESISSFFSRFFHF